MCFQLSKRDKGRGKRRYIDFTLLFLNKRFTSVNKGSQIHEFNDVWAVVLRVSIPFEVTSLATHKPVFETIESRFAVYFHVQIVAIRSVVVVTTETLVRHICVPADATRLTAHESTCEKIHA